MEIELHHEEHGRGEPLVLLHGNGENLGYFQHQIPAFAEHFRVIAVDTRGHGRSPRGTAAFTIRQFAEDLHDFLAKKDIPSAHILGFSDGGNIALCFALKYPQMVKSLVLNGANLHSSGVKRSVQLPIEIGYRIASLFAKKQDGALRKKELLGLMVNDPNIPEEELSRISVPALVIAGTKDMIRESHTRRIAECIPGAKLSVIPGSHFIAAENPNAFNEAVLSFLRKSQH